LGRFILRRIVYTLRMRDIPDYGCDRGGKQRRALAGRAVNGLAGVWFSHCWVHR
jgi:hypothetical protein